MQDASWINLETNVLEVIHSFSYERIILWWTLNLPFLFAEFELENILNIMNYTKCDNKLSCL